MYLLIFLLTVTIVAGEKCGPGTYANWTGDHFNGCIQCRPGTAQLNAKNWLPTETSCPPCPAGTMPVGAVECTLCPSGTFAPGNGISCTPCPSGTLAPGNGNRYCTPCPSGTRSDAGASSCFLYENLKKRSLLDKLKYVWSFFK